MLQLSTNAFSSHFEILDNIENQSESFDSSSEEYPIADFSENLPIVERIQPLEGYSHIAFYFNSLCGEVVTPPPQFV